MLYEFLLFCALSSMVSIQSGHSDNLSAFQVLSVHLALNLWVPVPYHTVFLFFILLFCEHVMCRYNLIFETSPYHAVVPVVINFVSRYFPDIQFECFPGFSSLCWHCANCCLFSLWYRYLLTSPGQLIFMASSNRYLGTYGHLHIM